MADLTIIMLTPNRVPKSWAEFHKQKLLEAAGDNPIITISKEPLDWGVKNLIQDGYGIPNLYFQVLRGAKLATTPFIAIADDDTLYPKEHFAFRPTEDVYFYNLNRWHIFTWGKPFYFHKPSPGNGCMISSREPLINALESRFRRNPELPGHLCHELGTSRSMMHDKIEWKSFYTNTPILSFTHEESVDPAAKRHRKYAWPVRAYDIPVWGRAEEIRKKFQ